MLAIHRSCVAKSLGKSTCISSYQFSTQSSKFRSSARTLYTTAFVLSAGLFGVYYFDARSALHRFVLNPILRNTLDAETSHKFALKILKSGLAPWDPLPDDMKLKTKIWEIDVSNPIGLAAGFDKDAEAVDGLFNLGFSWVEVGSVTPRRQPGNPRPRVFRLEEDSAIINRYGFPSQGHATVLARLHSRIACLTSGHDTAALKDGTLLAVNLGRNKDSLADSIEDFVAGVQTFGSYADVLVINVSSPNTPGLRGLQNKNILETLLNGVVKARDELEPSPLTSRKPKIVLKIAPDLEQLQLTEMATVIRSSNIDGVIVSNTTVQRPKSLTNDHKVEIGGLSGPPLKPFALEALRILRSQLPASVLLIGSGGIASGEDALEYAKAGATMVQVYTSFTYKGVGTCRRIKDELVEILAKEGKTWDQVVHDAVQNLSWKEPVVHEESVQQLVREAEELNVMVNKLERQL